MLFLLSDMFSRLMTSVKNSFQFSLVLNSSYCIQVLSLVYDLGFIRGYNILNRKHIKIFLKYLFGRCGLRTVYVVSKPNRRIYMGYKKFKSNAINNYIFMNGFVVCSTSRGIITDIEMFFYR